MSKESFEGYEMKNHDTKTKGVTYFMCKISSKEVGRGIHKIP